jgi:membrane associated rhomboid family serine protease
MIPINDTEPNRFGSLPFMTIFLIAVNVIVTIWELMLPQTELGRVFMLYGFIPQLIWTRVGAGMLSALTSTFLHGGLYHLFSNMIFLWTFGRRVEDACGAWRFLLYYLLAGTCASLMTAVIQPNDMVPSIGASGAIFGVVGAYLVLYPGGRIRTLVFITFVPLWPKLRAYWVVLYYLLSQIPPALDVYLHGASYNVGYWAHLGGFFTCIFIFLFMRPEAFARYWSDTVM